MASSSQEQGLNDATHRVLQHLTKENKIRSLGKRIMSRHDKQSPLGRQSFLLVVALCFALAATSSAQDWIRTGTGLGVEKVRLAAPDFKPSTAGRQKRGLLKTFNEHALE